MSKGRRLRGSFKRGKGQEEGAQEAPEIAPTDRVHFKVL